LSFRSSASRANEQSFDGAALTLASAFDTLLVEPREPSSAARAPSGSSQHGGWREAAKLLYREHLDDEGLDPLELRGKDLVCTCKLADQCHADVLLELANRD
jgi:hypothetical protein